MFVSIRGAKYRCYRALTVVTVTYRCWCPGAPSHQDRSSTDFISDAATLNAVQSLIDMVTGWILESFTGVSMSEK